MDLSKLLNSGVIDEGFLSGDYRGKNLEVLYPGADSAKAIKDLNAKAMEHGLNVRNLLRRLESILPDHVTLDVDYDPQSNELSINYLVDGKTLSEIAGHAQKRPDFKVYVDRNGIGMKNGLKVINNQVIDYYQDQMVAYTKAEKLLVEQINKFQAAKNNFSKNMGKVVSGGGGAKRAAVSAMNSIRYTTRTVQEKVSAVGDYKALTQEAFDARQGTGSKQSLLGRKGYVDVRPVIDAVLAKYKRSVYSKYYSQDMNRNKSIERAEGEIRRDFMQLLSIYAQDITEEEIDKQVKATNKFKYLYLSEAKAEIKALTHRIHEIKPYIGTSQENSVGNFLISLTKNSDLNYMGGLDDKSSRKRMQVANFFSQNDVRKKSLDLKKKMTKKGVVFTKAQDSNGISSEDVEMRMYGIIYATQEEIAAAQQEAADSIYEKLAKEEAAKGKKISKEYEAALRRRANAMVSKTSGAHSGGVFYSSDVESSFDAVQERFKKINKVDLDRQIEYIRTGKKGKGQTMTEEELKKAAVKQLLAKKSGLSSSEAYRIFKLVEGNNLDDLMDENGDYNFKYTVAQHMRSGKKLLSEADYGRSNAQAIDPEVILRLLISRAGELGISGANEKETRENAKKFMAEQGVSMLQMPEKLSYRNYSGHLASYLNGVFDYLRSNTKDISDEFDPFAGVKGLSGWLTYDKGKDEFIAKRDLFGGAGAKRKMKLLLNTINDKDGGLNLPDRLRDVFKMEEDGSITFDFHKFVGQTAVNQFAGYDYGDPGKTVRADYRFAGAIARGIGAASFRTKRSMAALSQFAQEYMKGDAEEQNNKKKLEEYEAELSAARIRTRATANKDFRFANEDIVISSERIDGRRPIVFDEAGKLVYADDGREYDGSSPGYLDISNPDGFKALESDAYDRDSGGKIKKSSLNGTLQDAIHRMRGMGPHKDGHIYMRPTGGAWAQFDKLSGKQLFGTAVSFPGFAEEDWQEEKVQRYNPDTKAVEDEILVSLPPLLNSFLTPLVAADAKYRQFLEDNKKDEYGRVNEDEKNTALEEYHKSIASTIAEAEDEVNSKNGSLFRMRDIRLAHSAMRTAEASSLSALGNDAVEKNLIDTSVLLNRETLRRMLRPQSLKVNDVEVGEDKDDYNASLKAYLEYIYGPDYASHAIVKDYLKDLGENGFGSANNAKLEQFLIDSVTFGSKVFESRKELREKTGERIRGFGGHFARFPLSNGLDIKDVDIFAGDDKLIGRDAVRFGLGLGRSVNADFDGDKIALHLDLAHGKGYKDFSKERKSEIISQKRAAVEAEKYVSLAVGAAELGDILADAGGGFDENGKPKKSGKLKLSSGDIETLFRKQAQEAGAVASRLNKYYTGLLSNNYQAITETMQALTEEGGISPDNPEEKEAFVRQMAVRGIFEGFTQDAISSKKVTQRISKNYGKGFADSLSFLTDLDDLMGLFNDQKTYESDAALKNAFNKAKEIGLMSDDAAFATRIAAQIVANAQQLYADEQGNVDTKGLAKALNITEEEAKNIQFKYSKDDKTGELTAVELTGGKFSNISMDSLMELVKQYTKNTGHKLGWVQRNKANRPGGVTTAANPAHYLGGLRVSVEELADLAPEVQRALGLVDDSYAEVAAGANTAATAINAEAAAEKNKIGIATAESKAINKLSKSYVGLVRNVKDLDSALKDNHFADPSVSGYLDAVFGNTYTTDTKGLEDELTAFVQKKKKEETETKKAYDFSNVPEEDLKAERIDPKNLKENGMALYWILRGIRMDTIEQVLGDAARAGIQGFDPISDSEEFSKELFDSFLQSLAFTVKNTKKKKDIQFKAGENGKVFTITDRDKAIAFLAGRAVQTNNEQTAEGIDEKIEMIAGGNKNLGISNIFAGGYGMYRNTLALAGNNPENIGPSEGAISVGLTKDRFLHGRFDRMILGSEEQKVKDGMGDEATLDMNTVTILDKKGSNDPSARYILQTYLYGKGMEQTRDYAIEHGIKTYEDFMASDLGRMRYTEDGKPTLDEETFYHLIGYERQKDKEGRTISWVPRKGNEKGAKIVIGINNSRHDGMNVMSKTGYSYVDQNRVSHLQLVPDKRINDQLDKYLLTGQSFENLPEFLQSALKNAYRVQTGSDLNFQTGEYSKKDEKETEVDRRRKSLGKQFNQLKKARRDLADAKYTLDSFLRGRDESELTEEDKNTLEGLKTVYQSRRDNINDQIKYLKDDFKDYKDQFEDDFQVEGLGSNPDDFATALDAEMGKIHNERYIERIKKDRDDAADELRKEYADLRRQKADDLRKKMGYEAIVGDTTGSYSSDEKQQAKDVIKQIDNELSEVIQKRLDEILEMIGENGALHDYKKEIADATDAKYDKIESEDKLKASANARLAAIRRRSSDRSKLRSYYKKSSDADFRVWKLDQALGNEEDEKRRSLILQEREAAVELAKIAKGELKEVLQSRDTAEWRGMAKSQQKRVNLEDEMRRNEFLRRQRSEAGNAPDRTDIFGLTSGTANWIMRLMQGGMFYRFMGMVKKGLNDITKTAKELDKAMTNVRIVTNGTADEAKNMVAQYADLAKTLGSTTVEVTNAAVEWLRQGYEASKVTDLITASMYLSKLGMIDSATATKDLTSAMKGFKLEASEAMGVVDKLTSLDLKAATSAGEIAEGLAQFANLATLSGVDIDQAAAYVATIADVTQASGSSVGAALKTVMSRFGNVKAGAYNSLETDEETTDTSETLNDVEKVLHKLNIDIRDSNLEFKDFDEVLDEIAERWNNLDNVSKKAIANAFAGIRQQEAFLTLMSNYDKYQSLLQTSRDSAGTAETKYQSYEESYEASKNRLTAAFEEVINSAPINNILTELNNLLSSFIDMVGNLVKYMPGIASSLNGFLSLFGGSPLQRMAKGVQVAFDRFQANDAGGRSFDYPLKPKIQQLNDWRQQKQQEEKERKEESAILKQQAEGRKEEKKVLEESSKHSKRIISDCKLEEAVKKNILTAAEKEQIQKDNVLTAAQNEKLIEGNIYSKRRGQWIMTNQESDRKKQVVEYSEQEKRNKEKVSKSGEAEAGVSGKAKGGSKSAVSTLMMGIEMATNAVSAAVMNYFTAGATHKVKTIGADGSSETREVQSSQNARDASRGWGVAGGFLSSLPVIGGILNTGFMHIADSIAATIDRERDQATLEAERSAARIANLDSVGEGLSKIAEGGFGSEESQKQIESLMGKIFSKDNEETRKILQSYLGTGESNSIYALLSDIKDNTASAAESYKKLQLAELEAKKASVAGKYADQLYNARTNSGRAYAEYRDYGGMDANAVGAGAGTGAAIATAGASTGAAIGITTTLLTSAAASSSVPIVGWIVGGVVALTALGIGIAQGVQTANAIAEENKAKAEREAAWNRKSFTEKIMEVQQRRDAEYAKGNAADAEILKKCDDMLAALQQQNSLTNQMIDEINQVTLQQGLISAKDGDQYLSDMTIARLKSLGIDRILADYAMGIEENGGLIGESLWADKDAGILSDSGYDYLKSKLKAQGDEEINAVLNGSSYTLSEVLRLREEFGDQRWIVDLIDSFAAAMGVAGDEIMDLADRFGELSLSELLMKTSDLSEELSGYTGLLSNIASGAGKTSEWMANIIAKFPDLIAYMSDLPTLFTKIGAKIQQLSEAYLRSQYDDITASEGFFKEIEGRFYESLSAGTAGALKDWGKGSGITSLSDVMTWLKTQYGADGAITEQGAEVLKAIKDTVDEYGMEVTSSILKDYYDQLIDFKAKALDVEINNLTEQKQALQDINSQREYENKLIEAKLRLENASKEKKRVYRAGVGWVYTEDQEAIKSAQDEIDSLSREKTASALEAQIAALESQKSELQGIAEQKNYEQLKEMHDAFVGSNGYIENSEDFYRAMTSGIQGISLALSKMIQDQSDTDSAGKNKALDELSKAWDALKSTQYGTADYNTALSNYHSAADAAKKAGAKEEDFNGLTGSVQTSNGSSQSAWNVASGSYDSQKGGAKVWFKLPSDADHHWEAQITDMTPQTDTQYLSYIFSDIDKGKGYVILSDGTQINTGDDIRFQKKSTDESLWDYLARINQAYGSSLGDFVLIGAEGDNEAVYVNGGIPYVMKDINGDKTLRWMDGGISRNDVVWKQEYIPQNYNGTYDLNGQVTSVNELGTEAIITPSGTITALPSHTGIVPADITKNLWALGEVAPSIMRIIGAHLSPDTIGKPTIGSVSDESLNINTLSMSVSADDTFDADAFVESIRRRAALTKNQR